MEEEGNSGGDPCGAFPPCLPVCMSDCACLTVPLSPSWQNLCINEAVTRLRSLTLINDRCLEMQKNKKKGVMFCSQ